MSTSPVMTVTDELLEELEKAAKGASHWNLDACFQVVEEGYLPDEWYWHIGHYDEGNQYPVLLVDTDQYDAPPSDAKAVARHYANCGSRNIIALVTELRRLRAEQAERDAQARAELAAAAERQRQAAEQARIKQEAAAREADKAHKAKINRAALEAFMAGGMPEECAKQAVTLIAKRSIPNVAITY